MDVHLDPGHVQYQHVGTRIDPATDVGTRLSQQVFALAYVQSDLLGETAVCLTDQGDLGSVSREGHHEAGRWRARSGEVVGDPMVVEKAPDRLIRDWGTSRSRRPRRIARSSNSWRCSSSRPTLISGSARGGYAANRPTASLQPSLTRWAWVIGAAVIVEMVCCALQQHIAIPAGIQPAASSSASLANPPTTSWRGRLSRRQSS